MKLATYAYGTASPAASSQTRVSSTFVPPVRARSALQHQGNSHTGDACLNMVRELEHTVNTFFDPADVRFLPPVPRPPKLIAAGRQL